MDVNSQKEWRKLEQSLEELASTLAQYSHEQLNTPPKDGGWSAMQCLHHLILAEAASHAYIGKKLQAEPQALPKSGLKEWFNSKKLSLFMRLPVKIKAPKYIDTEQLPASSDLDETLEKWRKQRTELKNFLDSLDDAAFELDIFKHPIAGKLKLSSMLAFFHEHFQRHRAQALRALASTYN